jgi:guanylate kinase
MPKNLSDLRTRLNLRGKDSEQEIEKRLKSAEDEMVLHDQFDYLIHSKTKDADYIELVNIYKKHSKLLEL